MRFGAAYWVQRTGWPELREAVLHAEASGFDDQWVDDHLLSDEGAWQDAKLEGWSTLAAVAAVTRTSRLGLMVAANTFRNPGLTAKLATTLDHLSEGRAILGIGAGWFAREHEAFGLDFGSGFGERLDRLAEAVPLIARSGDLWNAYGRPEELAASDAILRAACDAVGRDEREIERTVNANVVIRATREEARDAWRGWVEAHLPQAGEDRLNAFGTVEDVAAELDRYRAVGFEHPVLIFRAPFDLETMSRLPELRAALG